MVGLASTGALLLILLAAGVLDGDRDQGRGAAATTGTPTPPATRSSDPTPPGAGRVRPPTVIETAGGPARTFSDPQNMSGRERRKIAQFEQVEVTCRVRGHRLENDNDWWYRLARAPWNDRFYATADVFYNGPFIDNFKKTPYYDSRIPLCPPRQR